MLRARAVQGVLLLLRDRVELRALGGGVHALHEPLQLFRGAPRPHPKSKLTRISNRNRHKTFNTEREDKKTDNYTEHVFWLAC